MKTRLWACVVLVAAIAGQLSAAPITYEGTLTPGLPVTGSVKGAGATNCGLCGHGGIDTLDFWSFSALAGQTVTLLGTRLDDNLDLAFAVYSGITSVDASARTGVPIFVSGTVLGLGLLAVGDDEIDRSPFPWGDPLVSILIPANGDYTVAVSAGIGSGPDPSSAYQLFMIVTDIDVQEIPEPSTYAMLATGLAGLALAARKRRT